MLSANWGFGSRAITDSNLLYEFLMKAMKNINGCDVNPLYKGGVLYVGSDEPDDFLSREYTLYPDLGKELLFRFFTFGVDSWCQEPLTYKIRDPIKSAKLFCRAYRVSKARYALHKIYVRREERNNGILVAKEDIDNWSESDFIEFFGKLRGPRPGIETCRIYVYNILGRITLLRKYLKLKRSDVYDKYRVLFEHKIA